MTIDNNKAISWFDIRKGLLTYSMSGSRNGTDGTADCSGAITQAIRDAGGSQYAYLYSTVTLGSYLSANGFTRISENQSWDAQRGDIVLMSWGPSMAYSGGAGGHVGIMKDSTTFISVDYWTGGQAGTAVSEHEWDYYHSVNKPAYIEVWRQDGATPQPVPDKPTTSDTNAIAQFKAAGNKFTAYNTFKVDDIKLHNGIWQFVSYQLNGGTDVSWDDNGIPLSVVDNVTRGNDEDTQVGDTVKFSDAFNNGTIDDYDNATNAVGIDTGEYGRIWYNADAFLKI
ncbi:peptidoglycan amidohydrolase family protein [Lactococcus piscium]|uniref:Bacteriophage peptidoglycan hydrolase family lysin n=1 Tax=Pseudolactococcus piscium MKFS47 TaxID=297352 RepID=A0A0D6DZC7_9LACT|nr:peptidoglycan amidohydrolase family protein [Lactococcus piscium]CEN29128.1 Bacteriophage peptidoglycan hydrolase family lysin [Lactococcus piscium MKFS47]